MKLILLSDMHLLWDKPIARLDDAKMTQCNKLRYILDYACRNKMMVLQAGDFFDSPRSWRALAMYIDLLKQYVKLPRLGFGCSINAIFGQHDVYFYHTATRNATALGVLYSTKLLHILGEEPIRINENGKHRHVHIYGASYGQPVPEVIDKKALNILVIHKMIVKTKLWSEQENYVYASAFLKHNPDYHLILCGDAHQKFLFRDKGRIICNTGPLLRKEASEEMINHNPGFYEYNTNDGKIVWHEIPHEPAEKVLTRNHINSVMMKNESIEKFIAAVNSEQVVGTDFRSNLVKFLEGNEINDGVKEVISKTMIGELK